MDKGMNEFNKDELFFFEFLNLKIRSNTASKLCRLA